MSDVDFLTPSESTDDPSKVRRHKRTGAPYVKQPCPDVSLGAEVDGEYLPVAETCIDGKIEGKRPGTTRQCPKCKGKGYVEKLYSRCTSFVSVLDDRTQLEKWQKRIVLVGLAASPWNMEIIASTSPDDKDQLDSLADLLFELGDGHVKAQKGTDLHTLTEYVDKGWPLPASLTDYETGQERPVTLQDRADLAAWLRVYEELNWAEIGSECFVVNDEYQIGGTYDRRVSLPPLFGEPFRTRALCTECEGSHILDLKTGRIDYGAGKIAQQLAVYAHSRDYDPATGARTDQDVCQHVGIVVHLPQGTGEATVHVVDLVAGWSAVELSSKVREHRRMSREMIWPLESHREISDGSLDGSGVEA